MSGHSKWATIKRKKEKTDNQRGKIFTKLGREITIAAREGGPDPETNTKLRDAIAKARVNNMPNDSIMRNIKKTGADGVNYEELVYEGYGPAGIAIIVETATDNKNRTAGEMRHLFDKYGGNLGATGCVSWMFNKKGQIIIEKNNSVDEDGLMMEAIEAGAEDFNVEDEYYEILTKPEDFDNVLKELEQSGYEFLESEVSMIPENYVNVSDEDRAKVERLIEMLEDNDDVQDVYTNME